MEFSYESYTVHYVVNTSDCVLLLKDAVNQYEGVFKDTDFQEYSVLGGFAFVSKTIQDAFERKKEEVTIQSLTLLDGKITLVIRVSLTILPKPVDISLQLVLRKPNTVQEDIQELYSRLKKLDVRKPEGKIVDYKILALKNMDARNFDQQCTRFEADVMEHVRAGWTLYGTPTNISDDNQHSSTTFSQTIVKYGDSAGKLVTGYKIVKRNSVLKHKLAIEESVKEFLRNGWSLHGESYAVLNYGDPNDPSSRFYQFLVKYD